METSMTEKQTISTSPMKQSVSMTSLMPPPTSTERDQDVSDSFIATKFLIERPYNSLKKERNSEKDLWRNSWGSNQSFVGKDDFWLALQSNYNYIMDTNLIDSCREARGELERNYSTETSQTDQKKINGGKQSDDYIVDLKRLRLWLREMEKQLAQFPTISDAIKMKDFELERLQKKNEELYRIIAKHAKLIGACTRSLSRQREHCSETPTSFILQKNTDDFKSKFEQQQKRQQQQLPNDDDNCFSSLETQITRRSHSSNNSNNECNLKALERRYHSLYLKSFEISVLLENLLRNDDLQNSASHSSSSEVDEGPAAKLARFTNDLIAENHQRRSINPNQSKRKFYELNDEQASDDNDDCRFPSYFDDTVINVQTNGFDADSEGSDSELIPKMNNNIEEQATNTSTDNNGNPPNVSNNTEEMTQNTGTDMYGSKSASLPPIPSKQMAGVKRQRNVDATKFNRSNRESKNCGIFYFKHSDTEPETGSTKNNGNDWSSQATSELCSEEEWEYSKCSDVNGNHSNDNEDTIDNENLADLSIQVNANDTIIDAVDSPFAKREQCENEKFEQQLQSTPLSAVKSSIGKRLYKEIPKAFSKESIQQLVMGAENLVRDELLKTPVRSRRQSADAQVSARKTVQSLNSSKYKRVEHWLQNQSQPKQTLTVPTLNTDGEASCEYTESDARDSDGSEELADSVATTCLQATGNKSQCTSTEVITSSVDLLKESPESCLTNKVVPRINRRNSERPVSVSCISQLTKQIPTNCSSDDANNQGLANHSISESALHMLSIGSQSSLRMKCSDSKNSLKKRRMRLKKKQRSESGSNASEASSGNRRGSYSSLMKSESFSGNMVIKKTQTITVESVAIEADNEDEITLPKPNFQLGACTTNMFNSTHLGNLAPLAFYNLNRNTNTRELSFTGTEDNSNVSEQIDQVWDDYQEKYLSEAYSEGRDSDAARKLLEFGDDYRNFIDSQSDCCSSLSAANNLDSMSPPRGRKPTGSGQILNKSISKSPSDEDNAMRKRRAFEIEWRRRTHGENHRKPFTEERRKLSNGTDTILSRTSHKSQKTPKANISRKLEMEFSKAFFGNERRRMKSNESKEILSSSSSSAASSDAEDDTHIDIVLNQSRRDLENTQALKIRRHLLHSEDYTEIIATCSENMRCLKTVLHSPGGSLLSNRRHELIRELLSSWESLLHWSENESFVKQSQEEMATLVDIFNKIGTSQSNLDTESAIQFAIQEAKDEKAQLHTYRSSMLRLNASVHSWLTRHEKRKQIETAVNKSAVTTIKTSIDSGNTDENGNSADDSTLESSTITIKEVSSNTVGTSIDADDCTFNEELHKQLKNEVGNMYKVWDEADDRVKNRLESLTTSLIAWKQFENGINEFKEVLGKDTGALKRLTGALEMGTDVISNNLAYDVKEVAKRLSEKMDNQCTIATATSQQNTTSQPKLSHIGAIPFNLPSNGSLSDSGISDGGCSSDYGLSERERRLGALRRLAKQLEQALVPGSEALNSINQRMEMAEAELRSLQETCRELIIRTAVSQPNRLATASQTTGSTPNLNAIASNTSAANIINQQPINFQIPIINAKAKTTKRTTPNKRKQRRRTNSSGTNGISLIATPKMPFTVANQYDMMKTASEPDPDDPKDDTIVKDADEKRTWSWRVAKYAVPVQLALIALFCAACFIEPHCCDGANNFAWSLSPHLRYVRGPPPI